MVVVAGMIAISVSTNASPPAAAGHRPVRSIARQVLAPGLTYTRIADPDGPWIVHVLTVDPSASVTLDTATAGGTMGVWAKPSAIGAAHGALAAVNGDFTIDPGRPLHPFAEDGSLKGLGLQNGASFAISQDEQQSFIDTQEVTVSAKNLSTRRRFPVGGWNTGRPRGGEVVAFTPYGGSSVRPRSGSCSVRLMPAGKRAFGKDGVGLVRDYQVVRSRCGSARMGVPAKAIVLSSRTSGKGANVLHRVEKHQTVRLTWSYGWRGVMDSIGGMPQLVRAGRNIAHSCASYFCSRNPRTAIGITADREILLVTVDGRKSASVGMSMIQLGAYMVRLGAVSAVNLDGGGGATMWVAGQGVVNDPSDRGGERSATSAVLVLPGADDAEPGIGRMSTLSGILGPSVFAPPDAAREAAIAMALAAGDAGSTGGLLQALADDGDL